MRIAFMGTPDFAVPTLEALVSAGHEIAAVYSQPPRRAGRGKALQPSPVQRRAEALGLEVRTPETLRDEAAQKAFAALGLDAAVVAAYGLILPAPILTAPRLGCFNVHASLLPRWRGAAPIQRAILAGDAVTGVTIMQMERGLDTGPMLATVETGVDGKTAGELTEELARLGADLIVEILSDSAPAEAGAQAFPSRWAPAFAGALPGCPQPADGVTYAAKIDKAEARLDFAQPAEQVERQVRAFNPAPGAFFEHAGERVRVLAVQVSSSASGQQPGTVLGETLTIACAGGAIRATLVQRSGRATMTPAELLRGFPIPPGTRLA